MSLTSRLPEWKNDSGTRGVTRNVCEEVLEECLKELGGLSGEPALGDAVCDQAKPIAKEQDVPIQARREYLAIVWARYQEARTRAEKGSLLDEIVKNTGLHRDHAGRLMRAKEKPLRKAVSRKKGSW
jgi:hypothetical protein